MDEFSLIHHYFASQATVKQKNTINSNSVILGIGDDAAIVSHSRQALAISIDSLISGIHFPEHTSARDIACKALMVNLSDLAAMGATPAWFTLALSLPTDFNLRQTHQWLDVFSQELHQLAQSYALTLIGGDTTRGSQLSITIQIAGTMQHPPMRRANARAGDMILLSGTLGAAALGLKLLQHPQASDWQGIDNAAREQAIQALNRPQAEIEKGQILARYCQCAIDISDGLLADLGHICTQSHCGAHIFAEQVPRASCLATLPAQKALRLALSGGDDYRLCASMAPEKWQQLQQEHPEIANHFFCIGHMTSGKGITIEYQQHILTELDGVPISSLGGYNHFG